MILSLFAKSSARSKGILFLSVPLKKNGTVARNSPDAFQMHRTNLHYMSSLLALENTVTTTPRHASNVQQLRSVDHVVVFSPRDTNTLGFDLKAQAALIFPEGRSHPWLHTWWSNLTRSVRYVLCLEMLLSSNGTWWPGRPHGRQRNGLWDHSRAHGRRDWVSRSHWSHRTRILITAIAVRWV